MTGLSWIQESGTFSGPVAITNTTRSSPPSCMPPEEAVANALVANDDMTGRDGHRAPALPRDRVAEIFRARR